MDHHRNGDNRTFVSGRIALGFALALLASCVMLSGCETTSRAVTIEAGAAQGEVGTLRNSVPISFSDIKIELEQNKEELEPGDSFDVKITLNDNPQPGHVIMLRYTILDENGVAILNGHIGDFIRNAPLVIMATDKEVKLELEARSQFGTEAEAPGRSIRISGEASREIKADVVELDRGDVSEP